jgi:hypothetical protein
MSGFEQVIDLEGSQYNEVLILNKRGDNYQIILGRKPKSAEGTVMWQMCFPSYEKKPRDKAVPWCFTLGNMSQARKVAKDLCAALGVELSTNTPGSAAKELGGKVVDDSDSQIPF